MRSQCSESYSDVCNHIVEGPPTMHVLSVEGPQCDNSFEGGPMMHVITAGLYWVATHFPQWAGFFKKKNWAFKKVGFYKKI